MRVLNGQAELTAACGSHLGYSDWHEVTQEAINAFADATGDHQWIHVDVEQAAASPLGTTVAHGFLTLSLMPKFLNEVVALEGTAMRLNYGCNKVRFPAMAPAGCHLRGGIELVEVSETAKGTMAVWRSTIERQGQDKPVCVADVVTMLVWEESGNDE